MTIEDLLNYVNENLADGTLHMDSLVCVKNCDGNVPSGSFFNDADELAIEAMF